MLFFLFPLVENKDIYGTPIRLQSAWLSLKARQVYHEPRHADAGIRGSARNLLGL